MEPVRRRMLLINVLGGVAVLGSYAYCLATNPETRGQLWGDVPEWLQPAYTVSMLSAAVGYFLFTHHLFFRCDPRHSRVGGFDLDIFNAIYFGILAPSALWMPLTFGMLNSPSSATWILIRIDLGLVGISSLALIAALGRLNTKAPAWSYWLAMLGSIAFAVQTGLLDALVWPAFFP